MKDSFYELFLQLAGISIFTFIAFLNLSVPLLVVAGISLVFLAESDSTSSRIKIFGGVNAAILLGAVSAIVIWYDWQADGRRN